MLTGSIPIPANTRGVPQSSYGPTSPQLSTSPRNTFSISPGSHGRQRSTSLLGNNIARQLTAFFPADYPLHEENGVGQKRQGKQRILLLENINVDAAEYLKKSGFDVSWIARTLSTN